MRERVACSTSEIEAWSLDVGERIEVEPDEARATLSTLAAQRKAYEEERDAARRARTFNGVSVPSGFTIGERFRPFFGRHNVGE